MDLLCRREDGGESPAEKSSLVSEREASSLLYFKGFVSVLVRQSRYFSSKL